MISVGNLGFWVSRMGRYRTDRGVGLEEEDVFIFRVYSFGDFWFGMGCFGVFGLSRVGPRPGGVGVGSLRVFSAILGLCGLVWLGEDFQILQGRQGMVAQAYGVVGFLGMFSAAF